ncbi:MAG: DMT family transporter [Pseudomonadota bacterium]
MKQSNQTPKPVIKTNILAYALGLLGVLAFGATLPVTRIALTGFTPEFVTFARAVIACSLAILLLSYLRKSLFHPNNLQIFVAGIFLIFTFPGFMAIAMQTVPASQGGVVLGFLPLTTALIARIIAQEKPSTLFWILSILGCVIVIGFVLIKAAPGADIQNLSGYLWLIAAGLTASIGYVIFGKISRTTPGWEVICRSLILNLPLILVGFFYYYDSSVWQADRASFAALVYLGSFSMFLAFWAWNIALAMGGIARIGQLQMLQIFFTIAIAAILLDEHIDSTTVVTAIIITAILALMRKT